MSLRTTFFLTALGLLLGGCMEPVPSSPGPGNNVGNDSGVPGVDVGADDLGRDGGLADVGVDDGVDGGGVVSDHPWVDEEFPSRLRFGVNNEHAALRDFPLKLEVPNTVALPAFQPFQVRFYDDVGNELPHEVEYSGSRGVAYWVRANLLSGPSNIWMYFGSQDAVTPQSPDEIWNDYVSVYHFPGINLLTDSAGNAPLACDGTCVAVGGVGVGNGFSGMGANVLRAELGNKLHVNAGESLTVSAWYSRTTQHAGPLLAAEDSCVGWMAAIDLAGSLYISASPRNEDGSTLGDACSGGRADLTYGASTPDLFHQMVVVIDRESGNELMLYINGTLAKRTPLTSSQKMDTVTTLLIAGGPNGDSGGYFGGVLDEVQVIRTAMEPERIAAQYSNLTGTLVRLTAGSTETR